MLVPVMLYSSEVQQPARATAIMDGHSTRTRLRCLVVSRVAPIVCIQKVCPHWSLWSHNDPQHSLLGQLSAEMYK